MIFAIILTFNLRSDLELELSFTSNGFDKFDTCTLNRLHFTGTAAILILNLCELRWF